MKSKMNISVRTLVLCCGMLLISNSFAQSTSPPCYITVIDVANSNKTLSCTIKLMDAMEKVIYVKTKDNGKFDIQSNKKDIQKDDCVLDIKFDNTDYYPAERAQLRCPLRCDIRILAKKKPDFNSIRGGNPFNH